MATFLERASHLADHVFSLYFDYLYFKLCPILVLRASFGLRLLQFLVTSSINEPRCEKTGLWGFRPGPTQTGLYSYRWLEA